ILRQCRRPHEWHVRSPASRSRSDLLIVSRDNDAIYELRRQARLDAVREKRSAAEWPDILSGDRLRAAARRDDRDDAARAHHAVQPPSTTRLLPVIYEDASDRRNRSAPQYSWRSAIRPMGVRAE